MKTIGVIDLVEKKMRVYHNNQNDKTLFPQKRVTRMTEALADIRHQGNIAVYLVNGNKRRLLFVRR